MHSPPAVRASMRLPSLFTASPARRTGPRGWLQAAAVAGVCTLISELLSARLDLADIIMIYLGGVVYVALREGMAVSVGAVFASIFLFDLLFVPPRWGLNPINKSHFVTFAVMLAVGLLISRLADLARGQRMLAERRASRAQALAELSSGLAAAASREAIGQCIVGAVRATFGRSGQLRPAAQAGQGGSLEFPVQGASGSLGVVALDGAGRDLTAEERELLGAFAHLAALALERCLSEERSVAAQVEAEAERLRSTLLSGISHDFRTPLTTIVGAASSLLQQDHRFDGERRAALVRSVRDEAQRLHALVSDLLDLTRMEEGAVRLSLEWCPADDLVAEALAVMGARLDSHPVHTDVAAEAIVWCDPRLLEQALVNLVDNALRYTPAGTAIRISVTIDGAHWRLVVADAGPGLPAGQEQEVFLKFHRGQREPAGGGTGLGLAICAAVARLHGGSAVAANDGGARFTLVLPQPERRPHEPDED